MKKRKTANIIQRFANKCEEICMIISKPPWWLSIVISILAMIISIYRLTQ